MEYIIEALFVVIMTSIFLVARLAITKMEVETVEFIERMKEIKEGEW